MNIRIRVANGTDIVDINKVAFEAKAWWGYSPTFLAACRDELTLTSADLHAAGSHTRVGEFEDQNESPASGVLGFYRLVQTQMSAAELDAMFVKPEIIGCGVGRQLMQDALATCRRLRIVTLTVQSDPHAEDFYKHMGGINVGTLESGSIPGRQLPLLAFNI